MSPLTFATAKRGHAVKVKPVGEFELKGIRRPAGGVQ
jgi:hypothetical protein